jgi:uncharacterized protein YuzE
VISWELDERAQALYVRLSHDVVVSQDELAPGQVVVDVAADGSAVGIEVLGSMPLSLIELLEQEHYGIPQIAFELLRWIAFTGVVGMSPMESGAERTGAEPSVPLVPA